MKNSTQQLVVIFLILLSGVLGFSISYYQHREKNQTSDTQVIETFHYPALFVNQLKGDPDAGRKIFKEFCAACHDKEPKIDIHAPHIGDQNAWKNRQKLGLPILLKITTTGVGAMPARGGCFECSDEQLSETIQYMLKNSQ
jgi:cytochrome c5